MAGVGCGRQRGDAGRGRLPRARERTRPHLLGGFLDRHQGRRSRGGDNHRGHAAVSERCLQSLVEGKGRWENTV